MTGRDRCRIAAGLARGWAEYRNRDVCQRCKGLGCVEYEVTGIPLTCPECHNVCKRCHHRQHAGRCKWREVYQDRMSMCMCGMPQTIAEWQE